MADWVEVKKSVKKIVAKPRALAGINKAEHDANFRALSDRIPRENAAPPAKPKIKKGHEISGSQMAALKAGDIRIDAKLDLHGLTQREAHAQLSYFMKKQIARGVRLLLVITGKGKNNEGVLRMTLPGWLMSSEFKHDVLTIHPAHIKHGGDGATYVLLRRQIKQ
jgi:DNA-nicking Smr family endonuclease